MIFPAIPPPPRPLPAPRLDERGLAGLLADCFADGVVVAPGASAGEAYGSWLRLCYTALPPDAALEGVRRLARRLGRG